MPGNGLSAEFAGASWAQIRLEAPSAVPISEGPAYWAGLASLMTEGKITGPAVHDAGIAAMCLASGVRELWSADRDFSRFPRLRTVSPLL